MSLPLRPFVSASMCTAPVLASNVQFFRATAFAPGFTVPVRALPSHFNSTVTGFRWVSVGPQSPVHVPLNGSGAAAAAAIAKHKSIQTRQIDFTRISPPILILLKQLMSSMSLASGADEFSTTELKRVQHGSGHVERHKTGLLTRHPQQ